MHDHNTFNMSHVVSSRTILNKVFRFPIFIGGGKKNLQKDFEVSFSIPKLSIQLMDN